MSRADRAAIHVTVPVALDEATLHEIAIGMGHDELQRLILAFDLAVADAEFTESLIKALLASLIGDLDAVERRSLLSELCVMIGDTK